MDKILQLLTDIEIEAEKLEPSHRDALLDLIDTFSAAIKTLLDPKGNEPTGDEDKDVDERAFERTDHDSRLIPVADQ